MGVATIEDNSNCSNIKGLLSGWGLSLSGRPCDSCQAASALVYCRADVAFLCGPCDATIHHHTPHDRVWVCEVCEQAPAVVVCEADTAALCSACDHDIHSVNPLARRHVRVPITPFADSITARSAATSSAFLVPDDLDTAVPTPPSLVNEDADTWLIPNPISNLLYSESEFVNFTYNNNNNNNNNNCEKSTGKLPRFQKHEIKPNVEQIQNHGYSTYAFTDSVVPTQSQEKNTKNNFANLSETSLFENCFNIDFTQPNKHQKKNQSSSNKDHSLFSPSSISYSAQHSVSSSDIGVVPDNGNSNSMSEASYNFGRSTSVVEGGGTTTGMDREARVLRYREKRKNRKFQKTIRYASRKAYAETRPRIKGRFAKRTENNETSDLDFAIDSGYGVVPAF